MPSGDKSKYTGKQVCQAEHIEEGYAARGVPEPGAERHAWRTVNKQTRGGKRSGSGRGKPEDHAPARKGGKLGGYSPASRRVAGHSAFAGKAAATQRKHAESWAE